MNKTCTPRKKSIEGTIQGDVISFVQVRRVNEEKRYLLFEFGDEIMKVTLYDNNFDLIAEKSSPHSELVKNVTDPQIPVRFLYYCLVNLSREYSGII